MSIARREISAQELVAEAKAVELAVEESVIEALKMHKRMGQRVATWRDGQVVWIEPEDISVDFD
ncbi:MAG: hypothetical protein DWQ35_00285 [Planctomycetota bacterium]|nr:MAG: hypothetical protein DWQ35_00285 [Planctomycetota bacterium]